MPDLSAEYAKVVAETRTLKQTAYDTAALLAFTLKQAVNETYGIERTGRIGHHEPVPTAAIQIVEFDMFSGGQGDEEHEDYRSTNGTITIGASGKVDISLKDQETGDAHYITHECSVAGMKPVQAVSLIASKIQEMDEGLIGNALRFVTPFQKDDPKPAPSGSSPQGPNLGS